MKGKSILIFFILVALVDLFFVASPACNQFRIFSKPLLMPVLAVYLVGSGLTSARKKMLLAGLAFATAGDILLLKMESTPYFMGGLISFLLTYLLCILFCQFQIFGKKTISAIPVFIHSDFNVCRYIDLFSISAPRHHACSCDCVYSRADEHADCLSVCLLWI